MDGKAAWRSGECSTRRGGRAVRCRLAALAGLAVLGLTGPAALAQSSDAIVRAGERVVPVFSGLKGPAAPAPGTDPVMATTIDLDGPVLVAIPAEPGAPARPLPVTARMVGQVQGLAFDESGRPAIFVAATAFRGLPLVTADGARIATGTAGVRFMEGLFGPGGGPGSIWRVDVATGATTLFANLPRNRAASLGGLALDPASRTLFAADRQSGLIHAFDPGGTSRGSFDHGTIGRAAAGLPPVAANGEGPGITDAGFDTARPETWGQAEPARRPLALAVHDGRLFYAVAEGPQVWSVAVGMDGSFGTDARQELALPPVAAGSTAEIVAINFDREGLMTVTETAGPNTSFDLGPPAAPGLARTVRLRPDGPGRWTQNGDVMALRVDSRGPRACAPGGACDINFYYSNTGTRAAEGAPKLSITLDTPVGSFEGITTAGWTCTPVSATALDCAAPTGSLTPGARVPLGIRVRMTANAPAKAAAGLCATLRGQDVSCARFVVDAAAPAQSVAPPPRATGPSATPPAPPAPPPVAAVEPPPAPAPPPPAVEPPASVAAVTPPSEPVAPPPPPASAPPVEAAPPAAEPPQQTAIFPVPVPTPRPSVVPQPGAAPAAPPAARACPPGQGLRNGRCQSVCDETQVWNGRTCIARETPRQQAPVARGDQACPRGTVWDGEDCVDQSADSCPPGTRLTQQGCVRGGQECGRGFEWDADFGRCVRVAGRVGRCPPGTVQTAGGCAYVDSGCGPGFNFDPYAGGCVRAGRFDSGRFGDGRACPRGSFWDGRGCRYF
jgi:hypothetical protein